jgi:hypothetical protein
LKGTPTVAIVGGVELIRGAWLFGDMPPPHPAIAIEAAVAAAIQVSILRFIGFP